MFVVACALVGLADGARAEDAGPIAPDNGKPMVRYRDDGPRPGFHVVRSQMTGFFGASAFFFMMGYVVPIAIAADARFENGSAWLAVPFVGPFVGATMAFCGGFTRHPPYSDCGNQNMLTGEALMALGIVQIAGAALFPFGFLHRHYWQRDGAMPTISLQNGLRLGVVGTF